MQSINMEDVLGRFGFFELSYFFCCATNKKAFLFLGLEELLVVVFFLHKGV